MKKFFKKKKAAIKIQSIMRMYKLKKSYRATKVGSKVIQTMVRWINDFRRAHRLADIVELVQPAARGILVRRDFLPVRDEYREEVRKRLEAERIQKEKEEQLQKAKEKKEQERIQRELEELEKKRTRT